MTKEQIESLDIGIDIEDKTAVLMAQTAVEWLEQNTTIDMSDLENIPSGAKLFINKYSELNSINSGVVSESIEGLSQSFSSGNTADIVWDLAYNLIGGYVKSPVRFVTAQKRWL